MLRFIHDNERLLLEYSPDQDIRWVDEKLANDESVCIAKTFIFDSSHLVDDNEVESRTFVLASVQEGYYQIHRDILGLKHDLLISTEIRVDRKTFIAVRGISIFRKIDALIDEQIVIGGSLDNAIPEEEFERLLQNFPTTTELNHYADARIAGVLKEYLGTMTDAQTKLEHFLKRKKTIPVQSRVKALREYEVEKYTYIRDGVKEMLEDANAYSEAEWQKTMADFLLLLFPKYVAVLQNVHIKDYYSNPSSATDRYIDLALVDANGNIDIIEIKKPFENCLLSVRTYRDNYTPKKELSGAVVQVEKYLFHLNKWGREGEKQLNRKHAASSPDGMAIKITNPKAMLILGRDKDFTDEQRFDFEIIKRKYANIMDIMTYDDLLHRLENIIAKFEVTS
ncbi:Shedu immune nuclease family protein [Mariprofundus ferrooxydans]|uniref:Shedu immune nuclease family protein n=1 Tax=Mariprofundus ferrooxydans TaxID=314344 RepID=UPI0006A7458D|nr:Shedu immune nuclease family protein [Mariprofundus ferrooxydans]KON48506.1 hypothetical protein AL013_02435 [Mariprofundus ferrooxydans]